MLQGRAASEYYKIFLDRAGHSHNNLRSVSIPEKVERIGKDAFRFCSDLTTVDMPNHPILIEQDAFAGTGFFENEDFWVDGVLYIDGHLINGYQFRGEEYTVLPGTYSIAEYAFYHYTSDVFPLKKLTIPDSVGIIGRYAFGGCYNLEYVTLSQNVTYIGAIAFQGDKLNLNFRRLSSISAPEISTRRAFTPRACRIS